MRLRNNDWISTKENNRRTLINNSRMQGVRLLSCYKFRVCSLFILGQSLVRGFVYNMNNAIKLQKSPKEAIIQNFYKVSCRVMDKK